MHIHIAAHVSSDPRNDGETFETRPAFAGQAKPIHPQNTQINGCNQTSEVTDTPVSEQRREPQQLHDPNNMSTHSNQIWDQTDAPYQSGLTHPPGILVWTFQATPPTNRARRCESAPASTVLGITLHRWGFMGSDFRTIGFLGAFSIAASVHAINHAGNDDNINTTLATGISMCIGQFR